MYKHVCIPVDNSEHSNAAMELGLALAKLGGAKITGSHAYAAKLHDVRFKQMEFTLPEEYQEEKELDKQRKIHDSLITMGLQLISDSYLDVLGKRCAEAGIEFERRMIDGKNWEVIANDVAASDYDLVIMGALGTGAVKHSQLGSVAERTVRRSRKDVLVVKDVRALKDQEGPIVVGVDGSPQGFAGARIALELGKLLNKPVEIVSVYDPYLHYTVFNGIVNVLSEKASKIFRFKEQEQLHEDIIDTGLAKIYQSHLEVCAVMAKELGTTAKTILKDGKAFEKVFEHVQARKPSLLVVGRVGIHTGDDMDIGSNAENLLRLAPCNVLVISQRYVPAIDLKAEASMVWTDEATKRFERVPEQVRGVARTAVHRYAMERGHSIISNSIIDEVMAIFMPKTAGRLEAVAEAVAAQAVLATEGPVYVCGVCGKVSREIKPVVCGVCNAPGEKYGLLEKKDIEELSRKEGGLTAEAAFDGVRLSWTQEAKGLVTAIKDGYQRRRTLAQIEKAARVRRLGAISKELVEEVMGREGKAAGGEQVTPHVAVSNELASPMPLPAKWEKAPAEAVEVAERGTAELLSLPWSAEAEARLARVPQGFMRTNSKIKILEYAQETGAAEITLEVAEAGLGRARQLMAEMISAYSAPKK